MCFRGKFKALLRVWLPIGVGLIIQILIFVGASNRGIHVVKGRVVVVSVVLCL